MSFNNCFNSTYRLWRQYDQACNRISSETEDVEAVAVDEEEEDCKDLLRRGDEGGGWRDGIEEEDAMEELR